MAESLKSFKYETLQVEHEHRIEAHAHQHESSQTKPALTPAEALKNVKEANQESDSQKVLNKLKAAQREPAVMSHGDISRAQRSIAKKRGLKQVREHESLLERNLSRVIHQPAVQAVSEAAGKTVTRPSGLLGGGLVAFVGSGTYFILAKYLGFKYNYSVSLALFAGGFCFGLILELLVHWATASHRQVD